MKQLTAKEEAEDIYQMMAFAIKGVYPNFDYEGAKRCALIALESRMEELCILPYGMEYLDRLAYLEEIKEEINKL